MTNFKPLFTGKEQGLVSSLPDQVDTATKGNIIINYLYVHSTVYVRLCTLLILFIICITLSLIIN